MFQAIRTPWLSANQLGWCADVKPEEAQMMCRSLVKAGLLQVASSKHPNYPSARYAPTMQGLTSLANDLSLSPSALARQLKLSPARFWALRSCMRMSQELVMLCRASTCNLAANTNQLAPAVFEGCDWELFIPKQHKAAPLFLHGQIQFYTADRAFPFLLLLDRGESSVWQWYGHLHYLNIWAKRASHLGFFPPLLIISTRRFRARAMLALAYRVGSILTVAATADRDAVLGRGLLPLQNPAIRWNAFDTAGDIVDINPFAGEGVARDVLRSSTLAIPSLETLSWREPVKARKLESVTFNLPRELDGLTDLEALDIAAYKLLTFLSRNPVVPISCIATFSDVTLAQVETHLATLAELSFVETIQTQLNESVWAAADRALRLLHAREMQPAGAIKRYHFYRADHQRRLIHTLSTYRFFENLKKQCDGRSRVMRKLDTLPGTLNDGKIPYYELAVFESELMTSDWYTLNGTSHYWRPDGYGTVRAGIMWTRFWIEMDGTAHAPSRKDPAVWDGKMSRLCNYIVSQRWSLRYPEIPRLLIITTDLRNRSLIHDALVEAARARAIEPPQVFVVDAATLKQRGAGARIWQNVIDDQDKLIYPFGGWNI